MNRDRELERTTPVRNDQVPRNTGGEAEFAGKRSASSGLRTHLVVVLLFWTLTVGGLLVWDLWTLRNETVELAVKIARAHMNKDYIYWSWVASHGGVYVPANERTPPNPNLAHIPERNIRTPSGVELTLLNAAYMFRQLQAEYPNSLGVRVRITGLEHFPAEKAPDQWEREALLAFHQGAKEMLELTEIDGEPYLRLMSPLTAERSCVKCHASSGYKEGDIHGGTSVTLPMKPFFRAEYRHMGIQILSHASIYLIGVVAIFVGIRRLQERERDRDLAVAELHDARDELEYRIQERTRDLAKANDELTSQIAYRKRAEEALRESEQLHRQLSEVTFEGIAFHEDGRIIRANDQLYKMFGFSREELEGMQAITFTVAPDSREIVLRHIKNRSTEPYEVVGLRKDGTQFPIEIQARYEEFEGKKVSVIAVRDITERKRAEEAIRESEELYRSLVETTDTGYVVFDDRGVVLDANPKYVRLTGHESLDDILGRSVVEWTADHDRQRIMADIEKCVEKGFIRNLEIDCVDPNGMLAPIEINAAVVKRKDGKVITALCRDISHWKEANNRLKQSVEEKEVLVREIHHRVKNNLAVICSLLMLQSEKAKDDFHRLMFADAQGRIRSIAMAYERLCSAKNLAQIDMREYIPVLVDDVVSQSGSIGTFIETEIEVESIHLDLEQAAPIGFLVNEVTTNCVRHAFPNRERGSIHVSLQTVGTNELELTVKDNGIGLPDNVDFKHPQSLGLSLVDLFVQQLDGVSELMEDEGTHIKIRFRGRSNPVKE